MKKALLWLAAMAFVAALPAQTTVEFSDNFDSGLTNWVLTGNWGASTAQSYSPSFSLSESPVGDYLDNELTYATMANGVNLSTKPSAELKFYMRYEIEAGFDYMYLDVSNNNFSTFNTLDVFDGSVSTWTQYTYDLGGYCGGANTNVKIRFRFDSEGGWVEDGAYIDNFQIISSNVDVSPPLIVHAYPQFYKGSPGAHNVTAELIDISGIATSTLHYWVDDVAQTPISGVHSAGTPSSS